QLRKMPGGSVAEAQWAGWRAWRAGRAAGDGQPGWVTGRGTAEAYACDAQIAPVVTGYVDPDVVEAMIDAWLAAARGFGPAGARKRLGEILLAYAADALSGPGGLASYLRTSLLPGALPHIRLPDPAAAVSLPLDVGTATATIPPWLRRAVIDRDRHCAFPGCA